MWWSSVLITSLSVIFIGFLYVKWKYAYWKHKGVPYIRPTFPRGNIPYTKNSTPIDIKQIYDALKKTNTKFGGIFFFLQPVVLPIDLDFIKTLLLRDFNHFVNRGFYSNEKDDPISAHLVALEDDKWRNMRAKLTPTFTSSKMKLMFPSIVRVADELHETLLREILTVSRAIEMQDLMARYTTDTIGTCAFGIECNSLKDPKAEFRTIARRTFEHPKNCKLLTVFLRSYPNFGRKMRFTVIHKNVSQFFLNIVRNTFQFRMNNDVKRNDFLDLLIQLKIQGDTNGNKFTLECATAQAFLFFLAGYETSSTLMSFTLLEVSQNELVQERLRNEIADTLKRHNGQLTYEALNEVKYLEQTINESLRMYPPVPAIVRVCSNDYTIPDSNVTIAKGDRVFFPIYSIHHDPDIYPNPEVFDPERFSDEEVKKRHPCAFIPFGEGPRICIAMRFAMMQVKIGLITILKNFKIKLSSQMRVPVKFVREQNFLSIDGGLWLNVEKI